SVPPPVISSPSLHDALPISLGGQVGWAHVDVDLDHPGGGQQLLHLGPEVVLHARVEGDAAEGGDDRHLLAPQVLEVAAQPGLPPDRKSTRLNSSHVKISYAV